jgi:hypothetical protein
MAHNARTIQTFVLGSVVATDIDHRLVAGVSLVGAVIGFFGSLFFTYDVLRRPGGPLRWFLRVTVPAGLGSLVLAVLTTLVAAVGFGLPPEVVGATVTAFAVGGALLGIFNGLFVDVVDPTLKPVPVQHFFSVPDALLGMGICGVVDLLYLLFGPNVLSTPKSQDILLTSVVFSALGGAGAAGIWRFINRSPSRVGSRPPLFSGRGFFIGCITALLLPLSVFSLTLLYRPVSSILMSPYFLPTFALAGAGGGVTGGVTRYIFWWANTSPEHHLQIIGIWLISVAFLTQVVSPTLQFFDVALR